MSTTIKMRARIHQGGGVYYEDETEYTVDDVVAQKLIAQNAAIYVSGGPNSDSPVTATRDASENVTGLSAGGEALRYPGYSLIGTIASLGDSRASNSYGFGGTPATTLNATINRTALVWLNYMLGGPWHFLQPSTGAVAGERTDQWADGHAAILAMSPRPDFVFISFPTNNVSQGIDFDVTTGYLSRYISDHQRNGSRVILEIAGSNLGNDASEWEKIKRMNAWIKAKAVAIGAPIIDALTPTADPLTGQFDTGMSTDGTHEIPLGGYTQAKFSLPKFVPLLAGQSRFSRAHLWDTAAYNPSVAGDASGNPTFYSTYGTAGTRTKVARTDIPGEFAQVFYTSDSDTNETGWRQQVQLNGAWAASTAMAVGKRILVSDEHWVATTAGTTTATQPAGLTAASSPGDTVTDGTVVWTRIATITPGVSEITISAELMVSGTGEASPRIYCTFTSAASPDITFIRAMNIASNEPCPPIFTPLDGIVPVISTVTATVPAGTTNLDVIICARVENGVEATIQLGRVFIDVE